MPRQGLRKTSSPPAQGQMVICQMPTAPPLRNIEHFDENTLFLFFISLISYDKLLSKMGNLKQFC